MTEKLLTRALSLNTNKLVVLTSQSTFFQSCRDRATVSWALISTIGNWKCLAQGSFTRGVEHIAPKSDNLLLFKLYIYVDKFPKKGLTGDVFFNCRHSSLVSICTVPHESSHLRQSISIHMELSSAYSHSRIVTSFRFLIITQLREWMALNAENRIPGKTIFCRRILRVHQ